MAQDKAYGPDTLFVAVSDGDGAYAGEDGGPSKGGIGRWKVGRVGPWTSVNAPPFAHRDPETGLVWKGWVEVVEASERERDGTITCTKSRKVYAPRPAVNQRSAGRAVASGMIAPSAEAVARAEGGATPMTDALLPVEARKRGPGRPRKTEGRAMDAAVVD